EFELPEIEGIPLEKPVLKVSNDDVDVQVDRLRGMRGSFETLAAGKMQTDDIVMADVKMSSGGTALKEQENARLAARPQHLDGVPLEKLGDVLKGAKACDVRTTSGQIAED